MYVPTVPRVFKRYTYYLYLHYTVLAAQNLQTVPNNNGVGWRFVSKEAIQPSRLSVQSFFYGNQSKQGPTYALVGAESGGFRKISYFLFFPYNEGKEPCIGTEGSIFC